jgi:hypothetical protein
LILLLASPSVQAYSGYFYVIPTSAPLRECAAPGCEALLTVYQGDKVEILERTNTGWSKVRLVDKPAGIGWIPSGWLSFSPDRKSVALPTYYVNSSSLPSGLSAEDVLLRYFSNGGNAGVSASG